MSGPLVVLMISSILAALVLAAPVEMRLLARTPAEGNEWQLSVRWLFGLVKRDLVVSEERRRPSGAERPIRSSRPSLLPLLKETVVRERVLAFLQATLGTFTVGRSSLHLRIGLKDPAETGSVLGQIYSVLPLIRVWAPRLVVTLQPEFEQTILETRADCKVMVVPGRTLLAWSRLLLDRRTWRAAGLIWRQNQDHGS